MLKEGSIQLRKVTSIIGNFTWAIPTVPFAQAHYRSMQRYYIQQSRKSGGDLNHRCRLSAEACDDLNWWVSNLNTVNGKCFAAGNPDLEIYSDASLSGSGAVCNGVTTRGTLTLLDASRNINELELLDALFALKSCVRDASKLCVLMFLDNTSLVAYINHNGGTRSTNLTNIATQLSDFCEAQELNIDAVHLASISNVVADKESWAIADAGNWKLNPQVCQTIFKVWLCSVDLFSSAWNAQLDRFVT